MLTIMTWLWGNKFDVDCVRILQASVKRNLSVPHRFLCVTDKKIAGIEATTLKDPGFTTMPGCFARLRMFDTVWQRDIGLVDPFVCIDLDTIVTGQLDPLFERKEPLVIMQGANASNPCKFNGALIMLKPGAHEAVWDDFTLARAQAAPFHTFPDDQGWIWHKVPDAAGWQVGKEHGIYVYKKPGWPGGDELPKDARLVTFINNAPSKMKHLAWVKKHWRQ